MILVIYGDSKSGKTTLIENLTQRLTEKGFSVATVKHIRREGFTIDTKGKDTWRHANAGAGLVVASSDLETTFLIKKPMELEGVVELIERNFSFDAILVEGFKSSPFPKVALGEIEEEENTIFKYQGNEDEIEEYLKSKIELERIYNTLPLLDCEECGLDCASFAEKVLFGEMKVEECKHYGRRNIRITVNDRRIPLKRFPAEILGNAVIAMLSSLRGVGEVKSATIELGGL